MATIDEMSLKMTLYYSKSSGDIKSFCTGIQDMSLFGSNKEDFSLIWDYIILDKDEFVLSNITQFKINLDTKQLEIKQETIIQYQIAQ